ncbi:MAG: acylphosphatase [Rhodocyclaceae bacterium]|jgi:acylphosphatase
MADQSDVARHLTITGRVQGVGFRWSMMREAEARGVGGWVRNRPDGAVEAVVSGAPEAVAALIDWASHGPAGARVEAVEVRDSTERYETFGHRPNA